MEKETERKLYQRVLVQFEEEGNRLPTLQDLEPFVLRNTRTGELRLTRRGSRRLLLACGVSGFQPEKVLSTDDALFLLQLSVVLSASDRTERKRNSQNSDATVIE